MNDMLRLQTYLQTTGRYHGDLDGLYGPATRQAILEGMEDGPDTELCEQDYRDSAGRLGCDPAAIMAFAAVEANGAGFEAGEPKLLFEPHRFSKLTQGRFDGSNPDVSYPKWGARPYPSKISDRYAQLLKAVGLDVYAGFAAASYGKFQILGENHEAAGYDTPWEFAFAMAYDEVTQLKAFELFVRSAGILPFLRSGNWVECAKRYNGPAYAKNRYDVKLAQAFRAISLKLERAG